MLTLGPLGPWVERPSASTPSLHQRHQSALPILRRVRDAGRGHFLPGQHQQLDALAERLHSNQVVSTPPDSVWARALLLDLIHETGPGISLLKDLVQDLLLCLFAVRPPIFLRCEPPLDLARLEAVNSTVCGALLSRGPSEILAPARPALEELAYSFGLDHRALEQRLLECKSTPGLGWHACEIHLLRLAPLYDGLRYRFQTEYGTHAVHFGGPEPEATSRYWTPVYGRIEGQWTITGLSEGFWGKP